MPYEQLEQRYASGEVPEDSYVWHGSFDDWKPAMSVDSIQTALQRARSGSSSGRTSKAQSSSSREGTAQQQQQSRRGRQERRDEASSTSNASGAGRREASSQTDRTKPTSNKQSSRTQSTGRSSSRDESSRPENASRDRDQRKQDRRNRTSSRDRKRSGDDSSGKEERLSQLRNKLKSNLGASGSEGGVGAEESAVSESSVARERPSSDEETSTSSEEPRDAAESTSPSEEARAPAEPESRESNSSTSSEPTVEDDTSSASRDEALDAPEDDIDSTVEAEVDPEDFAADAMEWDDASSAPSDVESEASADAGDVAPPEADIQESELDPASDPRASALEPDEGTPDELREAEGAESHDEGSDGSPGAPEETEELDGGFEIPDPGAETESEEFSEAEGGAELSDEGDLSEAPSSTDDVDPSSDEGESLETTSDPGADREPPTDETEFSGIGDLPEPSGEENSVRTDEERDVDLETDGEATEASIDTTDPVAASEGPAQTEEGEADASSGGLDLSLGESNREAPPEQRGAPGDSEDEALDQSVESSSPLGAPEGEGLGSPDRDGIDMEGGGGLEESRPSEDESGASHGDLFDEVEDEDLDPEEEEGSFVPSAPKLGGDTTPEEPNLTDSLLIQLDEINEDGKQNKYYAAAGLAALVGLLGLIGYIGFTSYNSSASSLSDFVSSDEGPLPSAAKEGKIRTYSEDELQRMGKEKRRKIKKRRRQRKKRQQQKQPDEAQPQETARAPQPQESSSDSPGDPTLDLDQSTESSGTSFDEALESAGNKKTTAQAGSLDQDDQGAAKDEQPSIARGELGKVGGDSDFEAVGALGDSTSPQVKVSDGVGSQKGSSGGGSSKFSKEEQKRIYKQMGRVISECHARQVRQGIPVPANKVKLTVTIQPSGQVSAYQIAPESLQGGGFEECLESRKGQLQFSSFEGGAEKLRSSFIIGG